MTKALFTTSWDDGHPLDLRLAELLSKHGFGATFYVPVRNPGGHCTPGGLTVMSPAELRALGQAFEIGSHTLEHAFLPELDDAAARRQVAEGKAELEAQLGSAVGGFCYPGGVFTDAHVQMVREAGFRHARTIVNLRGARPAEAYRLPTTLQFYPHQRSVYLKNYLKFGDWPGRAPLFLDAIGHAALPARLEAMLDHVCATDGVFHLWGHSWEVDAMGGWPILERFLEYAADRIPSAQRLSNGALVSALAPA